MWPADLRNCWGSVYVDWEDILVGAWQAARATFEGLCHAFESAFDTHKLSVWEVHASFGSVVFFLLTLLGLSVIRK